MLHRLLSGDLPRNRWLTLLLVVVFLGLALTPFVFPGTRALNVAAKIVVFIVLVASFDLLLGYTGIVSFAHTMFFGIGAYGVAIASTRLGPTWPAFAVGVAGALAVSLALSLLIGLFSLRVRAIFFAMITLAVASAFASLASQLADLTGGEDGLTFKVPVALQPGTEYAAEPFLGADIDGRFVTYYLIFVVALLLVLALLRIVNSPFGRVLQAIRENDFRAEAIGYRTVVYRTMASVLSALFATLAGVLLALWLRYNGPDTTLVVRDHARRAADRRHRRHGNDLRRRHRQRAAGAGAELPAGPDEARRHRGRGHPRAGADRRAGALAAVARHPLRALGVLLPQRRRRPAEGHAPLIGPVSSTAMRARCRQPARSNRSVPASAAPRTVRRRSPARAAQPRTVHGCG